MDLDAEFILGKLAAFEAGQTAFLDLQREKEESSARIAAVRDREMLATIASAVEKSVEKASSVQAQILESRFGQLAAEIKAMVEPTRACIDEESRRRELLEAEVAQKPDREEFESLVKKQDRDRHDIETQTTGAVAALRTDIFDEGGVEPRLRAIEDAPGKKARRVLEMAGAAAIPVAGYGLVEFFKSIMNKGGTAP